MQYNIVNWKRASARANDQLEFLSLACTPTEEPCTPAGQDEDSQIKECTAFINLLTRLYGQPPEGAEFFIVENTGHYFGIYYEAGIFYKPTQEPENDQENIIDSESEVYAMNIEGCLPENWDAAALAELRSAGHPNYQPAKVVRMKAA